MPPKHASTAKPAPIVVFNNHGQVVLKTSLAQARAEKGSAKK